MQDCMYAHEDFTGGCVCVWKLYSAADKHDINRDSFSGLLEAQQPRLNISTIQIEQENFFSSDECCCCC